MVAVAPVVPMAAVISIETRGFVLLRQMKIAAVDDEGMSSDQGHGDRVSGFGQQTGECRL